MKQQRIKEFRQSTFKITIKKTAIGFGGERQMFEESVKRGQSVKNSGWLFLAKGPAGALAKSS